MTIGATSASATSKRWPPLDSTASSSPSDDSTTVDWASGRSSGSSTVNQRKTSSSTPSAPSAAPPNAGQRTQRGSARHRPRARPTKVAALPMAAVYPSSRGGRREDGCPQPSEGKVLGMSDGDKSSVVDGDVGVE